MDDFELGSLTKNGFDISLSFPEPLAVSASDKPDLVLLQLEFG